MDEKLYQNIDTPKDNPLEPVDNQPKDNPRKNIRLNPKFVPLVILGILILILSLVAIIVTSQKKSAPTSYPTPSENFPVNPNENININDSLIPTIFQSDFKDIDQSFKSSLDLPPPEIDTSVGL